MTRRNGTQKRRCPFCNRLVVTLYPATHQAKYTGHHIRTGYVCDYCASMGLEYGKPVPKMTPEEKRRHYRAISHAFGERERGLSKGAFSPALESRRSWDNRCGSRMRVCICLESRRRQKVVRGAEGFSEGKVSDEND